MPRSQRRVSTQLVQQANQLGGLETGSTYGLGELFVHGLDGSDPLDSEAPFEGVIKALSPDGASTLWTFALPMSVFAAPLTLANGVVYVNAPITEANVGADPQQFSVIGLHAETGTPVAAHAFPARAISGR